MVLLHRGSRVCGRLVCMHRSHDLASSRALCVLNFDLPVVERHLLVHFFARGVCFLRLGVEDICEASRCLGHVVLDDINLLNGTKLREHFPQGILGRTLRDACNVDVAIMSRVYILALLIQILVLLFVTLRLGRHVVWLFSLCLGLLFRWWHVLLLLIFVKFTLVYLLWLVFMFGALFGVLILGIFLAVHGVLVLLLVVEELIGYCSADELLLLS